MTTNDEDGRFAREREQLMAELLSLETAITEFTGTKGPDDDRARQERHRQLRAGALALRGFGIEHPHQRGTMGQLLHRVEQLLATETDDSVSELLIQTERIRGIMAGRPQARAAPTIADATELTPTFELDGETWGETNPTSETNTTAGRRDTGSAEHSERNDGLTAPMTYRTKATKR